MAQKINTLSLFVLFGDRLSTSSDDSDSTVTLALGRDEAFIRRFRAYVFAPKISRGLF